jgi:hypothetical protein
MIRDRLIALGQEGFVEIVGRPGFTTIYYARITDEGKAALRGRALLDDLGKQSIFVSCGQVTEEERDLGTAISLIINEETSFEAYYAESQTTLEGVSAHILGALSRCVGFVGVMHHRGCVTEPGGPFHQRASVWVEQELAIAAYRIHTLGQILPVQLYIQNGIKREGMRDKLMLNPTDFLTSAQVREHFRSIVKVRFGALPEN